MSGSITAPDLERSDKLRRVDEHLGGIRSSSWMEKVRTILAIVTAAVAALLSETVGDWGKEANFTLKGWGDLVAEATPAFLALICVWYMWLLYSEIVVFEEMTLARAFVTTIGVAAITVISVLSLKAFPIYWLYAIMLTCGANLLKVMQMQSDLKKSGKRNHPFLRKPRQISWPGLWGSLCVACLVLGSFSAFSKDFAVGIQLAGTVMILLLLLAGLALFSSSRDQLWVEMYDYLELGKSEGLQNS